MTEVITFLLTLAFAGGGAWVTLKEAHRHVNGLGAKITRLEEERKKEQEKTRMALVAVCCDNKTAALDLLGDK